MVDGESGERRRRKENGGEKVQINHGENEKNQRNLDKQIDEKGDSWGIAELILSIAAAIALRTIALNYSSLLKNRVELTSQVYSFEHLKDGVAILTNGFDPYETSNFYFSPITLHFFSFLLKNFQGFISPIWIALDIATALILSKSAEKYVEGSGKLIFYLYAFNPVSVVSTGIISLTVMQNFLISAVFSAFVQKSHVILSILIGIWSSFTIYPIILISTLFFSAKNSIYRFILLVGSSMLTIFVINVINYVINGYKLNYLSLTYGTILNYTDIQPNVGLFWYVFVQIFKHFRDFYTVSFTLLFFFAPIPTMFMIRKDPLLHFIFNLLMVSVFFPYPTLNQVTVVLTLLPLLKGYQKYSRFTLPIAGTIVSTICLMPVMWHMWIVSSSGNANFFFGATLFYNVALIYIGVELIFVYARHQIDREYGDAVQKNVKFVHNFY